jgi:hypothetical protein
MRVDQDAAVGMGCENEGLGAIEQRFSMASGDRDAALCVERDGRCAVKHSTHALFSLGEAAHIGLAPAFRHFFLHFPTLRKRARPVKDFLWQDKDLATSRVASGRHAKFSVIQCVTDFSESAL